MIGNYVKVALRNLLRQRLHSFITIAGLSFGLVCFLMMFGYLQFEMSYDDFHANAERIFRLDKIVSFKGNTFPRSLVGASTAPLLREAFPSIESVVRFGNLYSSIVNVGDNVYVEKNGSCLPTAPSSRCFVSPAEGESEDRPREPSVCHHHSRDGRTLFRQR